MDVAIFLLVCVVLAIFVARPLYGDRARPDD
jgi:hypothetical protein